MSRPAVLAREARDDLRIELRWVGPVNMARARGLRDAVQVAARRLGEHPLMGRAHVDLLPAPYRFWSLTRFRVVLIYDAASEPRASSGC